MREKFEASDYDHIYQDRAKHFSPVFKTNVTVQSPLERGDKKSSYCF